MLHQDKAGQKFLGNIIVLKNPNAGVGQNMFSLLNSILHSLRQINACYTVEPRLGVIQRLESCKTGHLSSKIILTQLLATGKKRLGLHKCQKEIPIRDKCS